MKRTTKYKLLLGENSDLLKLFKKKETFEMQSLCLEGSECRYEDRKGWNEFKGEQDLNYVAILSCNKRFRF